MFFTCFKTQALIFSRRFSVLIWNDLKYYFNVIKIVSPLSTLSQSKAKSVYLLNTPP